MIDVIFIIILAFGSYAGYKKGFILEIIGIIALFLGLWGAFMLLKYGITYVARIIPEYSNLVPFIAFLVIFLLIIILVNILGRILKRIVDMTILGSFDSLAGAILGFFMWSFVISLFLWLLSQAGIGLPENQTDRSYIYPFIVSIAPAIGGFIGSLFPFAETLIRQIKDIFIR